MLVLAGFAVVRVYASGFPSSSNHDRTPRKSLISTRLNRPSTCPLSAVHPRTVAAMPSSATSPPRPVRGQWPWVASGGGGGCEWLGGRSVAGGVPARGAGALWLAACCSVCAAGYGLGMSRTTPARPVSVEAVFPELAAHRGRVTRLHPRPGRPGMRDSHIGGPMLWPQVEPWPLCREPHRREDEGYAPDEIRKSRAAGRWPAEPVLARRRSAGAGRAGAVEGARPVVPPGHSHPGVRA